MRPGELEHKSESKGYGFLFLDSYSFVHYIIDFKQAFFQYIWQVTRKKVL